MVKSEIRYKCDSCSIIHKEDWQADDCCRPSTTEVKVYLCKDCDIDYETRKEAFECCRQTHLFSEVQE